MNLETSRPNVPGPCGGCPQARECCSDVTLTFTPDKAAQIPDWFLDNPDVAVVRQDEVGGLTLQVEGVCPAFDEETYKCVAYGEVWRSEDCNRFPLDNDGMPMERLSCSRWSEFAPQPVNGVMFDEGLGLVLVR